MQAACTARRWLARNAAHVMRICSLVESPASACASLVASLPALEHAQLCVPASLTPKDLGCLLEVLAWCPRLEALALEFLDGDGDNAPQPFPAAPAFAGLRSLVTLDLAFGKDPCTLTGVVDTLVPLTGLMDLRITLPQSAVVPAALGQLKALKALLLHGLSPCVLEAGCLDLPSLRRLELRDCKIEGAAVLPGLTALQSLTNVKFSGRQGLLYFSQLIQLPQVQRLVLATSKRCRRGAHLWLPNQPANSLSSVVHLDISGHELTQFPLALTRLAALKYLNACANAFAELPTAITALSRLTGLNLEQVLSRGKARQLHELHPLNVRALGDLSAFPALCLLRLGYCKVLLC